MSGVRGGARNGSGSGTAALELSGLSKSFGERRVLDGVSLSVGAGEIVALVGPSGSGKSTLLSLLTGALAPDAGEIRFGGAEVSGGERPFAFMPQRDVLLPWRRVLDNAGIGLEVAGLSRRESRERARELLAPFGLAGTEELFPRQLSGGMRQRVSFLRTVVQGKPVLLLDEPFGALDAITREELQRWLLEIWGQHGWSILIITHDIREAVRLADRALVLGGSPGRIVGEVEITRDIPRGEDFYADRRVPPLEGRLHALLGAGEAGPDPDPLSNLG
ncbi:ABC transporter ATP-binding protein [Leucobacter luti]|uniref:ABC transporter ATP-binding protein n=1 Tax=Leucobacter luti TaxID=340320 RepID=UPI003D012B66